MIIAKIVGTAVASAKHDALHSSKILLASPANVAGEVIGDPFLAVDLIGSGEGELVMVSRGSSARLASEHKDSPVDAAVVGIIDTLHYDGKTSFRKE